VREQETGAADGADAEVMANRYEFLILNGLSGPADLDQAMREAHWRVHLRGLDALRRSA
jgi:hypothetical protein